MSTLPRPTGKELIRALERAGFAISRVKGSHHFLRHADGRATVIPMRSRTIGLGLLRKVLADAQISPEDLERLL